MSLIGQTLGKYQILEELGRGGMGLVYKAYDASLDRQVAIKVLAPYLVSNEQFVQRFHREARSAGKLSHPNIITIHEVGQEGDLYYFVMEYLPGQSLEQMIAERGALPPEEILSLIEQVAAALDYAHERGYLHRDIKPANILINEQGQAVLTDFGLVRAADGLRLTGTGVTLGTPEYMAPEQARGEETTQASDIYALGVLLYEMLTGVAPFQAPTPPAVLLKHMVEAPPSPRSHNPALPESVERVVLAALSKDPAQRPASAAALVAGLRQALTGAMPPLTPTPAEPVPVPAPVSATPVLDAPLPASEGPPPQPTPVLAPPLSAGPGGPVGPPTTPPGERRRRPPWQWALLALLLLAILALCAILGGGYLKFACTGPRGEATQTPPPTTAAPIVPTAPPATDTPPPTTIAPSALPAPTAAPSEPPPTDRPLPTATPEPTETPPVTSTPEPTETPAPTDTPQPTATVSPTPCPPVWEPFKTIWDKHEDRLGCALEQALQIWLAQEDFERGYMLWREDTAQIYVLYNNQSWAAYADPWQEGDPEYSCTNGGTPSTPPFPRRGFGQVWCEQAGVRDGLGWATDDERGFYGMLQDFEGGTIVQTDTGEVYLLFQEGSWIQY